MNRFGLFWLKNRMLLANMLANVIGVGVVRLMTSSLVFQASHEVAGLGERLSVAYTAFSFLVPVILIVWYEGPIRRVLEMTWSGKEIPSQRLEKARRKLLNEPFFLILMDFALWCSSAVLFPLVFWASGAPEIAIYRAFFISLDTGLITCVSAFFLLEWVLQRHLVPVLFPEGRLYMTPGTFRIRIGVRLFALVLACNVVPFFSILNMLRGTHYAGTNPAAVLDQMRTILFASSLVFIATGICLTTLVAFNLKKPLDEIIRVLRGIRHGRLDERVGVVSNDEIGYAGDVINEMTQGLRERERMRYSLNLAMEVQQSLLPDGNPSVKGLDIAGRSIYCDETGGDYYDFLHLEGSDRGRISVVVGDVSDHGLASALLMASARAFLRQRASLPGDPATIMTDVNRQVAKDVGQSGRFITLLYMAVDLETRSLRWVRAGHEPGLFYDPATDSFETLMGSGMALGVDEGQTYQEYEKPGIAGGQIILLGTDGIWEAHNGKGEMFGKKAVCEIIRQNASRTAWEILNEIVEAVRLHQKGCRTEDDMTLVIIKIGEAER